MTLKFLKPTVRQAPTSRVGSAPSPRMAPAISSGGSNGAFYAGKRWVKLAARIRDRANGLCEHCGRRPSRLFVDHIHEVRDGGAIWEPSNLQALCGSCHSTKTAAAKRARERRGRP